MKHEFLIILCSFILAAVIGFTFFNMDSNLTGLAIKDLEEGENYTREDALEAIEGIEDVMNEMRDLGFGFVFINDSLIEANRLLIQVDNAEILRGNVKGNRFEAQKVLKLIDWEDLDYGNVVVHFDAVRGRKSKALLLSDELGALKIGVEDESEAAKALLNGAEEAFNEERYDEADELILDVRNLIEEERSQVTILSSLTEGAKNFIQKNWIIILVVLIVLIVGGRIFYKKNAKRLLKKKIKKMKFEKEALIELMRKAQTQRFKENSISGLVYNARLNKYKDRIREIGEKLPVLEGKLKGSNVKKLDKK